MIFKQIAGKVLRFIAGVILIAFIPFAVGFIIKFFIVMFQAGYRVL